MEWLGIVLSGVSTIVNQWMVAGAEERAAIEARALKAVADMVGDRESTKKAHDDRTTDSRKKLDEIAEAEAKAKAEAEEKAKAEAEAAKAFIDC